MAFGFSPIIPLQRGTEDGFYELTKTIAENTKQNLKNLLLTSPGERVMLPDFGAGLRNHLFSNRNESIEAELTFIVESQVRTYLPYIKINNIEFIKNDILEESSQMQNTLNMKIVYSIPEFNFTDLLTILKIQYL